MHNLDATDKKILKLLQEDAKLTAREISEKISLSQTPVYERIKKLEKKGLIKSYVAIVEPKSVDKGLIVFASFNMNNQSIEQREAFVGALTALEEVMEVSHVTGKHDYIAKLRVKDINDFQKLLQSQLSTLPNVDKVSPQIVLDELKHTYKVSLD